MLKTGRVMKMSKYYRGRFKQELILYFFLSFLLIFIFSLSLNCYAGDLIGHQEGEVTEVYNENGDYIFGTARGVAEGDRYISSDNIEYVIEKVEDGRAEAVKKGEINLLEGVAEEVAALPPLAENGEGLIGLYHTHNGESYRPGPENEERNGDIYEVGKTLKNNLEKKGIKSIHSDRLHLPHDAASYERSRATAVELAEEGVDAIFDLHRDAIPRREEYLERVNRKLISQVRIVIGRQNPNNNVNEEFARRLKAVADEYYPGLIRDIFYGRGNYNQQVSSQSLLLEFGTHVTSKEQARASAVMMADALNRLLYGAETPDVQEAENRSSIPVIFWMIVATFAGIAFYLYINKGSWEEVMDAIRSFFSGIFTDGS